MVRHLFCCVLLMLASLSCTDKGPDYVTVKNPLTNPLDGPPAGNPNGHCPIPAEAGPADVSHPDHVIGSGTPESCTPEAFIAAVAKGGTIVFNGGTVPFTITLKSPARYSIMQSPIS